MANDDIKNLTIIEIGNDTTKMLAGSFLRDHPFVYCVSEVPTMNVLSNGIIKDECLATAVAALKQILPIKDETIANKCSTDNILFVLPPDGMKVYTKKQSVGVLARSNNSGRIDIDDVRGLLKSLESSFRQSTSNCKIVDIIPGVYRYGGKTSNTPPCGEQAEFIETEASIHCVPIPVSNSFENVFKAMDIKPSDYSSDVAPYCASKMINLANPETETYIILDLGAYSSSVSFVGLGNLYHSMSFPLGMNHLTEAIASNFDIDFKEAEKLKRAYGYNLRKTIFNAHIIVNKHGEPLYQMNLNKVIEGWFKEFNIQLSNAISTMIQPSLKINSPKTVDLFNTCPIFMVGGGANLNGIEGLIKDGVGQHSAQVFVPEVAGARDPKYVNLLGLLVHKCTSSTPLRDTNVALSRVKEQQKGE